MIQMISKQFETLILSDFTYFKYVLDMIHLYNKYILISIS